jgi:AcrR family transcriptional regulator
MAKPLVAVNSIYDCALRILEEQGAGALSARRLADELQCSTRTLYQQVGKRDELISQLIAYYFGQLKMVFRECEHWEDSTRDWARNLRFALLSHPGLSRLMTAEHRGPIAEYVTELLQVLLRSGFNEELALRSCRVLVHVVMNLSLAEISAPANASWRKRRSRKEIQFEDLVIARSGKRRDDLRNAPEVFENTLDWVIIGIQSELE